MREPAAKGQREFAVARLQKLHFLARLPRNQIAFRAFIWRR
jgi:hypothetical protein